MDNLIMDIVGHYMDSSWIASGHLDSSWIASGSVQLYGLGVEA